MTEEIKGFTEFKESIEEGPILIAFFKRRESRKTRYALMLIEDIKSYFKNVLKVKVVFEDTLPNLFKSEEIVGNPHFKLYINGTSVWEQIGCLMNYDNDILVLKRSIREALKSSNV